MSEKRSPLQEYANKCSVITATRIFTEDKERSVYEVLSRVFGRLAETSIQSRHPWELELYKIVLRLGLPSETHRGILGSGAAILGAATITLELEEAEQVALKRVEEILTLKEQAQELQARIDVLRDRMSEDIQTAALAAVVATGPPLPVSESVPFDPNVTDRMQAIA